MLPSPNVCRTYSSALLVPRSPRLVLNQATSYSYRLYLTRRYLRAPRPRANVPSPSPPPSLPLLRVLPALPHS